MNSYPQPPRGSDPHARQPMMQRGESPRRQAPYPPQQGPTGRYPKPAAGTRRPPNGPPPANAPDARRYPRPGEAYPAQRPTYSSDPRRRPQAPYPQAQRMNGQPQRMQAQPQRAKGQPRNAKAPGQKKKGGVPKWVFVFLDLLIVVILLVAAWFLIKPKLDEKDARQLQDQLRESLKANKNQTINVEIDPNFGSVVGGEVAEGENGFIDMNADRPKDQKVSLTYVGRLIIPKISVDIPTADSVWEALRFGVGIHPEYPGINDPGLSLIFGHRFLTRGRDFNQLDKVQIGDEFYLDYNVDGKRHYYKVFDIKYIPAEEIYNRVKDQFDQKAVMLITCHPPIYGASTERILVYAYEEPDKLIDIP